MVDTVVDNLQSGEIMRPRLATRWVAAMRRGDYEAAWRQTDLMEARRRALEEAGLPGRGANDLLWNGHPFSGRRVVVRCNHGLGDTLQFIRFVPWIVRQARSVAVLAQPPLVELLRLEGRFGRVVDGWAEGAPADADLETEVMELAYAFRVSPSRLAAMGPYLGRSWRPGDERWARRRGGRRRVGLVWASSNWDAERSIPIGALAPIGAVEGVEFYNFQQGPQREEACGAPFVVQGLERPTVAIVDAARAMLEMDLVICVDGLPAHLAGALGRPVWLLLRQQADWRWKDHGEASPWYGSMRLFRQQAAGGWEAVAGRVSGALRRWAG